MQLSVSIRTLLVSLMVFLTAAPLAAQEKLKSVQLVPVGKGVYKVRYTINLKEGEKAELKLRMVRNVQGKESELGGGGQVTVHSSGTQTLTWTDHNHVLKDGDRVRAEITAVIRIPHKDLVKSAPAGIEGPSVVMLQLPDNTVTLHATSGSASNPGIRWEQLSGPPCRIEQPGQPATAVTGLQEGMYTFALTVIDPQQHSSSARVSVIVKAPPVVQAPPKTDSATQSKAVAVNNGSPATPNSEVNKPQDLSKAITYTPPKLETGPSNAFINLLLPGLGHYRVSGNYSGDERRGASFLVTAFYLGAAGGAVYFKMKSIREYNTYAALAKYREYQKDPNGNIIGVRGGNEAEGMAHYHSANLYNKYFYMLAATSAGTLIGDFVWTLAKGMKNKRAYDREYRRTTTSFFYNPMTRQANAGLSIQF